MQPPSWALSGHKLHILRSVQRGREISSLGRTAFPMMAVKSQTARSTLTQTITYPTTTSTHSIAVVSGNVDQLTRHAFSSVQPVRACSFLSRRTILSATFSVRAKMVGSGQTPLTKSSTFGLKALLASGQLTTTAPAQTLDLTVIVSHGRLA